MTEQDQLPYPTLRLLGAELDRLLAEPAIEEKMRRKRRTRMLELGLAALVVAGVAIALVNWTNDDQLGTAPASASQVLRDAARAERGDTSTPRPGEYLYTRSREAYLTTTAPASSSPAAPSDWYSYLSPEIRETWIGPDGAGRIRTVSEQASFLSDADRLAAEEDGAKLPEIGKVEVTPLARADASDLPDEPAAVIQELNEQAARSYPSGYSDVQIFSEIGAALREPQNSDQRAALFEVLARLEGIELVGSVTDPEGRDGIAVAMDDPKAGVRHTLIFDPGSYELLAETDVISETIKGPYAAGKYPVGTVIGSSTYLDREIVGSRSETP